MPRKTADLHGILVAVSTPFTADASAVDEQVLAAQAEWAHRIPASTVWCPAAPQASSPL